MVELFRGWEFNCCLCRNHTEIDSVRICDEEEDCPICFQKMINIVSFRGCGHAVCYACIEELHRIHISSDSTIEFSSDEESDPQDMIEIRYIMREMRGPRNFENLNFDSNDINIYIVQQPIFRFRGYAVFWHRDSYLHAWILMHEHHGVYTFNCINAAPRPASGADFVEFIENMWISW